MIEIDGKVYRNIQEQVEKNKDDIADLQEGVADVYTKEQANTKFVSKANLTDYSINSIIAGNSEIDGDDVELRAVSSQDVKSEVSLEPTSAIIRTMSGTDVSTIGISATEIDITTPMLKYDSNEVLAVDSDKNLTEQTVRATQITSIEGEDSDNKGSISLHSSVRAGSVYIQADGVEASASLEVRGTTSGGSEGLITLNGQTQINTTQRIEVSDGSNTDEIAYLSDLQALSDRIAALEQALQNNNN